MINIDRALRSSIKSGKVVLGSNRTVEVGSSGQAKLIIFAVDWPMDVRMQLESMDVPVYGFEGMGKDLDLPAESLLCGHPGSNRAGRLGDHGAAAGDPRC